jgi:hypothetical protein
METELISKASKRSRKIWQASSPMRQIKRTTEKWQAWRNFYRRNRVTLSHVRMGHTKLTHGHHMDRTPPQYANNASPN